MYVIAERCLSNLFVKISSDGDYLLRQLVLEIMVLKCFYQVFEYLTWLHDVIWVQAAYEESIVHFLSATSFYI